MMSAGTCWTADHHFPVVVLNHQSSSYMVMDHFKPVWFALTLAELLSQVKQL